MFRLGALKHCSGKNGMLIFLEISSNDLFPSIPSSFPSLNSSPWIEVSGPALNNFVKQLTMEGRFACWMPEYSGFNMPVLAKQTEDDCQRRFDRYNLLPNS